MEKIKIKTDQLAIRQNLEKNALKQKLDLEYEEMKRKRNDEIEKIGLKYKKRKIELTIHHNSEKSIRSNPNTLKKSILYVILRECFNENFFIDR